MAISKAEPFLFESGSMASTISQSDRQSSIEDETPKRMLNRVHFCGTGSFAPDQVVGNEDLARLGADEEWIIQRTGIRERRHAPKSMSTGDMACMAGQRCLEQAGVPPEAVDLMIICTMTPDYFTPATSCLVQKRLGMRSACMDLNAACSGFLYGMITGAQFVQSGSARYVLVIGADVMSRVANPNDVKTYPLFGDGAGALLLSSEPQLDHDDGHGSLASPSALSRPDVAESGGILAYNLGADGDTEGWLCVPGGAYREPLTPDTLNAKRNYLVMDGRPVFKWAVRTIADSIIQVMKDASVGPEDISLVVLHQANIRIIDAAVSALGFPRDRVFVNLDRYGNTSAGSVPLALDEANREGRIQRGDKILFCGFGSGLSWGACVAQW